MPRDGFSFTVRVSRQKDLIGIFRQFLELGDDCRFALTLDVFWGKIIQDIDAQLALWQVDNMPHRGLDRILCAQEPFEGFSFRW